MADDMPELAVKFELRKAAQPSMLRNSSFLAVSFERKDGLPSLGVQADGARSAPRVAKGTPPASGREFRRVF
jgi:hypothetical protein